MAKYTYYMENKFMKESVVTIENQNIMTITGVEKVVSFSTSYYA